MAFKSSKSGSKSKSSKKTFKQQLPPSLVSELLLMQFIGGGSIERHAKRVMEQQARDAAPVEQRTPAPSARPVLVEQQQPEPKKQSQKRTVAEPLPVAQTFRDERGNLWWDEHEEAEYRGLLVSTAQALEEYDHDHDDAEASQGAQTQAWVSFDGSSPRPSKELRRASTHSEFSRVHVVSPPPSLIDSDPFYSPYTGCAEDSSEYTDVSDGRSDVNSTPAGECEGEESGKENDQNHEDLIAPAVCTPANESETMKKRTGLNLKRRARALFRVGGN